MENLDRLRELETRLGQEGHWAAYRSTLEGQHRQLAAMLRQAGHLSSEEEVRFRKIESWPRFGNLRNYLHGPLLEVWRLLDDFWYGELSQIAHQRSAPALATNQVFAVHGASELQMDEMVSEPLVGAALAFAIEMGEIEAAALWASPVSAGLRDSWAVLAEFSPLIARMVSARYEAILRS